jgi:hypothetical protein
MLRRGIAAVNAKAKRLAAATQLGARGVSFR